MNPTDLFQLPAGTGYMPWSEMETVYTDFAAAMKKRGPEYFYDYNPVTGQWMLKESHQMRVLVLMQMDLDTVTLGDAPKDAAPKKESKRTVVFFTGKARMSADSVLRDMPEKGESITVASFIATYPELAASFDGADRDGRMDYFFTKHVKRTEDGAAVYVPIGENAQLFREMLEEEANARYD